MITETSSNEGFGSKQNKFISNIRLELRFVNGLLPLLIFFTTTYALPFITVAFAGRISEDHLAGVGLGNTVYNVGMFAILFGYSSIFDTYGPQVYGSKQRKDLGTLLVKCCAQGLIVYLLILGPYLNTSFILAAMPQLAHLIPSESDNSELTVQEIAILYIRLTCTVGFFDYLIDLFFKYLAIQEHSKFVYVTALAQFLFHVLYNYLMVILYHLGVEGLAYAAILGRLSTLTMIGVYFIIRKNHLILPVNNKNIFNGWNPMVKLGTSGAINLVAEVGLYEIASFLAQYDGEVTLSTILIVFQLQVVAYPIAMSMSYMTAMMIGEKLAEGNKDGVRTYIKCGIINAILQAILLVTLIYFFREYYVRLFTSQQEVIDMFNSCLWLILMRIPIDHLQFVISRGILIAFGKQKFIAVSLSLLSYGVGTPILIVSVFFTDLKATGIIIAFVSFVALQLIIVCIKLKFITISDEIDKTKIRVGDNTNLLTKECGNDVDKNGYGATFSTNKNSVREEWKSILLVFIIATVSCAILSGVSVLENVLM